jgi:hypothetical protein
VSRALEPSRFSLSHGSSIGSSGGNRPPSTRVPRSLSAYALGDRLLPPETRDLPTSPSKPGVSCSARVESIRSRARLFRTGCPIGPCLSDPEVAPHPPPLVFGARVQVTLELGRTDVGSDLESETRQGLGSRGRRRIAALASRPGPSDHDRELVSSGSGNRSHVRSPCVGLASPVHDPPALTRHFHPLLRRKWSSAPITSSVGATPRASSPGRRLQHAKRVVKTKRPWPGETVVRAIEAVLGSLRDARPRAAVRRRPRLPARCRALRAA